MEYNEIRALLARYWEGETSLEEEELLCSFYAENKEGLPADLQEAAPLFGYFAAEVGREMPEVVWEMKEVEGEVPEGVSGIPEVLSEVPRVVSEMPEVASEMQEGVMEVPVVNAEGVEENTSRSAVVVSMPRPYQHWMKYAAVLLLGVGLVYSGRQFKSKQDEGSNSNPDRMAQALNKADTYEDSKEAYAATKKALELLAKNLNKGTTQAKKLAYFNEATEYIKAD